MFGLLAWVGFGVMVVAPWFDDRPYFFSARFYWAVGLTPIVLILALVGLWLAQRGGRGAAIATLLSGLAGLAVVLYLAVPWVLNWLGASY